MDQVSMSYKEWVDFAIVEYDLVSKYYSKRVYEALVSDPKTGDAQLVQLTLREVLNKCQDTVFETRMRRAIMKCVYTDSRPEREIRKIMDDYYGI